MQVQKRRGANVYFGGRTLFIASCMRGVTWIERGFKFYHFGGFTVEELKIQKKIGASFICLSHKKISPLINLDDTLCKSGEDFSSVSRKINLVPLRKLSCKSGKAPSTSIMQDRSNPLLKTLTSVSNQELGLLTKPEPTRSYGSRVRMEQRIKEREAEFFQFKNQLENADSVARRSNFPKRLWEDKLKQLILSAETELVLKEKELLKYAPDLKSLCNELQLHCQQYQKVIVVSKLPLPNYREDLDHKKPQRVVTVPEEVLKKVEYFLENFERIPSFERLPPPPPPPPPQQIERAELEEPTTLPLSSNSKMNRYRLESLLSKHLMWKESLEGQKMARIRESLPAYKEKILFLQAVERNQVIVISGETGCGKTTQLPQYILESEIEKLNECNIICTQPRKISAISVAERVAAERGEEIGQTVGYQVRLDSQRNKSTRLLFCTTGILLRRLSFDPHLNGVTHVVVDEIHERGMNEDFLLIILKDLLPKRRDLKLILMSATLNAELFSNYFGGAPTVKIPGFTHPVQSYFLEDILPKIGHNITPMNQVDDYGADKQYKMFRQMENIKRRKRNQVTGVVEDALNSGEYYRFPRFIQDSLRCWSGETMNFSLIEAVLSHIVRNEGEGSVLVFMTGWEDICGLLEKLRANPLIGNNGKTLLLTCHSGMASEEQKLIFSPAPPGLRKIILATNIAETSITINDCVFVVDAGKAKETSYDVLNNTPCLLPTWISKASVKQRKGRAGRVQSGVCYHLYTQAVYERLADFGDPELLRTPLQSLCLQIKSLNLGGITQFLSKAIQPPDSKAVENAVELLEDIGALSETEELTALGRHLSALPLEPCIGKMLIVAAVLGCLNPLLTVASGLADRDPWLSPMDKKELADEKRLLMSNRQNSDHLALVRAYDQWTGCLGAGWNLARDFCFDNFLSMQTLNAMSNLRAQFLRTLKSTGLVESGEKSANENSSDEELIKGAILAGLWPGVALAMKRGKSMMFKTKEDGEVNLHPSSVNSKEKDLSYPWLAFSEKVKTSSVFIRDSTGVSDMAVLLFGGHIQEGTGAGHLTMRGGYLEFFLSPKAAKTILEVRKNWEMLLQRKMQDPSFDFQRVGADLVEAMKELLHSKLIEGSYVYGRSHRVKNFVDTPVNPGVLDAKSLVHNFCAQNKLGKPSYQFSFSGPLHSPRHNASITIGTQNGVKTFRGAVARSKKVAETNAALVAWHYLSKGVLPESGDNNEWSEEEQEIRNRRNSSPRRGGTRDVVSTRSRYRSRSRSPVERWEMLASGSSEKGKSSEEKFRRGSDSFRRNSDRFERSSRDSAGKYGGEGKDEDRWEYRRGSDRDVGHEDKGERKSGGGFVRNLERDSWDRDRKTGKDYDRYDVSKRSSEDYDSMTRENEDVDYNRKYDRGERSRREDVRDSVERHESYRRRSGLGDHRSGFQNDRRSRSRSRDRSGRGNDRWRDDEGSRERNESRGHHSRRKSGESVREDTERDRGYFRKDRTSRSPPY